MSPEITGADFGFRGRIENHVAVSFAHGKHDYAQIAADLHLR
jgi:hypothetical protein